MTKFVTDIAVIGAGPVGLFSIFEAGMLKMKCNVIDTLDFIGGQCTALYPEKPIYDIPGHPEILASDLIEKLSKQAEPFKPIYHLGQRVEKLQKTNGKFLLTTSKNTLIEANSIIIAAGCGAFGPNRPPTNNIEAYEGKTVLYMVNEREKFRNKRVVIAGGGDSAIDWAISLSEITEYIYLVHRRPKFRCAPENLNKINQLVSDKKIEMVVPYQLEEIEGDGSIISSVIVKDFDNNLRSLRADYLLPFFGLSMELGPIAEWGLNINHNHIDVDNSTMQTSSEGIYAIGDIINYPGKLKLILSGFAEAAIATYSIYPRVHPNEALHFEYSTTKGIIAA
ncbi:MAG: NAD(P)/FAD-dependent oxidoreductase [Alphaproteobacteria bacterium]